LRAALKKFLPVQPRRQHRSIVLGRWARCYAIRQRECTVLGQVGGLVARRPAPRLDMRDPMALRALVLVLVVTAFIAAGGERG
jgi:hypothetical protein